MAERLGVTLRTVRRDIRRLRDLGYSVSASPGVLGGYELGVGTDLPPLLLGEDEAVALVLGLRSFASPEDASMAVLSKVERLLPTRLRERVAALQAATIQTSRRDPPSTDPGVIVALAQACRRLEIDEARTVVPRTVGVLEQVDGGRPSSGSGDQGSSGWSGTWWGCRAG